MGQVLASLQSFVSGMWASLRAQPRSNIAGYINPRLRTCLTTSSAPHQVPNASKIHQLQKVKNLRDLAEACPNIAPGRLMRSACPSNANDADIATLRQKLGITQLVDLRSGFERSEDPDSLLTQDADLRVSKRSGSMATMERFESAEHSRSTASDLPPLIVHHLSLLERSRYYKAILLKIPLATSAYALFWMPFDSAKGKGAIMKEINRGGLPMLYEIILEIAGPEIKCALEVITEAAEAGSPILFFCRVGKDRTGVLAALLLACCGAQPEEIIADYHRSDSVAGEIALGGLEKEDKELHQLDFAVFSKAPAEVMAAFLTHLDERYGGPLSYLDSVGFTKKQQTRLRQAVCITGSQQAAL